MNHRLLPCIVAVVFATLAASAEDKFPGQRELSAAYDRVAVAAQKLNTALRRSGMGAAAANDCLGEAKALLEAAAKDKKSPCESALKLVDQARQQLSAPTATLDRVYKALQHSKEALKEITAVAAAGK